MPEGQDPNMPGGDTGPNSIGSAIDAGRKPQPAQIQAPTKMGRALEVASGGFFDPTGGIDQGKAPSDASGSMKPTKFGALMKIIQPMMEGATIGGFMGKTTPGGGFGAAQNMFMQRRLMQMQQNQFLINLMKMNSEIQKNQAEAQWAQRRPMVTRTAPAIKGYDESGKPIFMQQNPQTGTFEPVEGIHPGGGNTKEVNTDQGIVTYDPENPRAGALPLRMGGSDPGMQGGNRPIPRLPGGPTVGSAADAKNDTTAGTAESASEPSERTQGGGVPKGMFSGQGKLPTRFDSGSPSRGAMSIAPSASPGAIASGGVPLHAPGFSTPKATVRASRNAAGVETDNIFDTNPNSPTFGQRIAATGNTRQPVPDKVGGRESARNAQKASDVERSEQYAAAALAKSGGDPDKAIQSLNGLKIGDPDAAKDFNRLLPQIRKSITDRAKQRKPKAKGTNPLGIPDADWQKITGGQAAPDSNDEE